MKHNGVLVLPSAISGAIYSLERGPRRPRSVRVDSATIQFEEDWAFCGVGLSDDVVDPDTLHEKTYDLLQKALDIRTMNDSLRPIDEDAHKQVVLFRRDGGTHITYKHVYGNGIRVDAQWEHKRENTVIATSEDEADAGWHESWRFIRRALSAQDAFDAYRNFYLALESLLSDSVPRNPKEPETGWLKRALKELTANHGLDLTLYTSGSPAPSAWVNQQYEAYRCTLFHAKSNAGRKRLPGVYAERAQVVDALTGLQRLVVDLSAKLVGAPIAQGGITYGGMQLTAEVITNNNDFKMGWTEDDQVVSKEDHALSPNGLPEYWVPGRWTGRPHTRSDSFRFEGHRAWDEPEHLVIGRVGMGHDVLVWSGDFGKLEVSDARSWHYILDWGIFNSQLARNPWGE